MNSTTPNTVFPTVCRSSRRFDLSMRLALVLILIACFFLFVRTPQAQQRVLATKSMEFQPFAQHGNEMMEQSLARTLGQHLSLANRSPLLSTTAPSAPEQSIFAELNRPLGVTVDSSGNVYVISDNTVSLLISKFAPDGRPLRQVPFGNITSSESLGHLAFDQSGNTLWNLGQNGIVSIFDSDLTQVVQQLRIRNLPVDVSSVYDVASGITRNFGDQIIPSLASYGDIALLRSSDRVDAFVAGISVASPFIARITLSSNLQQLISARVIVASIGTAPGSNSVERGVAVNSQGTVLATLPVANEVGTFDVAVTFPANFPQSGQPPQILFNRQDISSRGFDADAAGNFYVTTGSRGASFCGQGGSGALVVIPAARNNALCLPLGAALLDSLDIGVNRAGTPAYMTVGNAVIAFNLSNSSQPCAPQQISIGQTINGQLTTSDCPLNLSDGMRFSDRYVFDATAGQQISISLSSPEFDTYLGLFAPDQSLVSQDNDGGGGTHSRIPAGGGTIQLTQSGSYLILVTSNLTNRTGNYSLQLSGSSGGGNVPNIVVPATLDFEQVVVGSSRDKTLTVQNTGAATLSVTNVVSGNVPLFTVTSPTTFSVPPNGSSNITIRFSQFGVGQQSGALTISSNDPDQPQVQVQMRGEGVNTQPPPGGTEELKTDDGSPEVGGAIDGFAVVNRLTPSSFPAKLERIRIGFAQFTNSPNPVGQQIMLLYAVSNSTQPPPLSQFTKLNATVPGINNFFDFTIANGPTIPSGSQLYVGYQAPTPNGGVGFIFDDNGQHQDRTFLLGQDGNTFLGPVPPNDGKTSFNALIRAFVSTGGSNCNYSLSQASANVPASGGSGNVSVTTTTGCNWTATSNSNWLQVTSGSSGSGSGQISYSVQANTSSSPRTGTLTIAGQTFTVNQAAATASSPAIDVQPADIDFGNVNVGATVSRQIVIRNTGNANLILNGISTNNAQFRSGITVNSFTLQPGGQLEGAVTFTPSTTGLQQGLLAITSNDPNRGTLNVQLRGTGGSAQPSCPLPTGLNPISGPINTPVTVSGTNLAGVTQVRFTGGALATPTVNSAGTSLQVTVPTGAQTGPLTLIKSGCAETQTQQSFTVNNLPPTDRIVRIVSSSATPGQTVSVPIELAAQGDENALSFSLTYDDPQSLTNPVVTAGRDLVGQNTLLQVNTTQAATGRISVLAALGPGISFPLGKREVVVLTFNVGAAANNRTVRLEFADSPAPRQVGSINQTNLPAGYVGGTITISTGLEGDVTNDGEVNLFDVQRIATFALNGGNTAQPGSEFQRADCAPLQGGGDGRIDLFDVQQAARWALKLDLPIPSASGPTMLKTSFQSAFDDYRGMVELDTLYSSAARAVRIINAVATANSTIKVVVELESQGDENALTFSLNYDNPQLLTNPQIEFGKDVTGNNRLLQVNTQQAGQGRVGILIALAPGQAFASGKREIAVITFNVAATSASRVVNFSFGDMPTPRQIGSPSQQALTASYATGTVTVNPAVSPVSSVSAASFVGTVLAPESMTAAFGSNLATAVQVANVVPLPTQLAGTTVKVKDSAGTERLAPLFFVAPTQINYLIPPGTAAGAATVTITSGDGSISNGEIAISSVAPGLFTANASGQGIAAATVFRVKADGSQLYEPVSRFDSALGRVVPVPIDLNPASDQVFLLLFGSGCKGRSSLANVQAEIGGVPVETLYVGPQGDFVGLDQLNLRLPSGLAGRGEVQIRLVIDGKAANVVTVAFK